MTIMISCPNLLILKPPSSLAEVASLSPSADGIDTERASICVYIYFFGNK